MDWFLYDFLKELNVENWSFKISESRHYFLRVVILCLLVFVTLSYWILVCYTYWIISHTVTFQHSMGDITPLLPSNLTIFGITSMTKAMKWCVYLYILKETYNSFLCNPQKASVSVGHIEIFTKYCHKKVIVGFSNLNIETFENNLQFP